MQAATSEAHELLKKEIAAATADDSQELPDDYFDAPGNLTERISLLESDLAETENISSLQEPEDEEEEVEIKKLAIPRRSAAQLANKARKAGDTPDIVRDSITKVTLFDYSDIIAGEDDEEEDNE